MDIQQPQPRDFGSSLPYSIPVPSPKGVKEFGKLYQELVGRELSEAEAEDYARRLLLLYYVGAGNGDEVDHNSPPLTEPGD